MPTGASAVPARSPQLLKTVALIMGEPNFSVDGAYQELEEGLYTQPELRNGTLVRVMPNYRSQELNLYAIYPSRQYLDAKIKTWVEYLRGSLPEILSAHQAELAAHELSGTLAGARLTN